MPDALLDSHAIRNLLALAGGDRRFLVELIDTFLADSPRQISAMKQAAADVRPEEFRRAAHSLKANAANFGAMDLSRLCKELEELGKEAVVTGAAELVAQIEVEYARVANALRELNR